MVQLGAAITISTSDMSNGESDAETAANRFVGTRTSAALRVILINENGALFCGYIVYAHMYCIYAYSRDVNWLCTSFIGTKIGRGNGGRSTGKS